MLFRISENIGDVNYLAFHQRSPHSRTPVDTGRVRGQECFVFARVPEHRLIAIDRTLGRANAAISASHKCAADSTSVLRTLLRSKVERLMTLSTSAVAVCCCRDSRSSLSRRVFSMAMTAWLREIRHQLDLLVAERPDFLTIDVDRADQLVRP